jgi:hypothetical protein
LTFDDMLKNTKPCQLLLPILSPIRVATFEFGLISCEEL